ncbi:MFS general substrate transporter [Aureobasidium sp. EXF-8845]|nr:MFS general substrate transporter [Aureobasidium sp. EXF-8845]KAI4858037.1 MFS general substrate transporter [Aureobasidium sp. EXF-8846]
MHLKTLKQLDSSEGNVQLIENYTHHPGGIEGDTSGHTVLVPQPSSDPNDPLTWSRSSKNIAFLNVCAFTFLTNVSIGGLSPAFYGLSLQFGKSISVTTGLLIWPILVLGLGNFFWVPTAVHFGKRPVFVIALALLTACNAWSATSKSFDSLLAARVVAAFAGSSTEALGAAIVNDLFFLHERGAQMGIYIVFLAWGNSLGPLCGGFITSGIGWRWFCWICTIFCAVNLVAVFFFVPETRFKRELTIPTAVDEIITEQTADDKAGSTAEHVELEMQTTHTITIAQAANSRNTYLQRLSLWSGKSSDSGYLIDFIRPFPLVILPAVFWAVLICKTFYGYLQEVHREADMLSYADTAQLACIISVSTLNSFVLQAPPYSFNPGINGLINIPAMNFSAVGNIIGATTSGRLSDLISKRDASRQGGVFKPESRLIVLCVDLVAVPAGLLMFGFGCALHLHWAVIYVGYGLINIGLTSGANMGMIYVMDCYFPIAPEALLVVNGLKNVAAFGIAHGVIPWVTTSGYKETWLQVFGALTGIYLGVLMLVVPFYFFGERIRHWSSGALRIIL